MPPDKHTYELNHGLEVAIGIGRQEVKEAMAVKESPNHEVHTMKSKSEGKGEQAQAQAQAQA